MTYLLHQPHHDGSALYVKTQHPAFGDRVTLRVRVPRDYPLRGLYVRSIRDGEPRIDTASIERADAHERWWHAQLLIHNPVTHYRFLLDGMDGSYAWLTARGLVDRDVTDDHDFRLTTFAPPPAWAADAVVYEVFPDRFARSGNTSELPDWAIGRDWYADPVEFRDADAVHHVYGGDLAGIEQHLDHLTALGCNTLYLTPFFEAPSNHRYNAASFDDVDPILGGNAALASLTAAAHARGIRVLGDLTTNHTGDEHPWFRKGVADRTSAEAGMFYWRDHPDYVAWLDVATLPKLNWSSAELRSRMTGGPDSVVARWLREPYSLDGWRVDVVNMTGRFQDHDFNAEVGQAVRENMVEARPDALLIAEHGHDYTRDIAGDGWHATMNYAGFLRPLWQWLVDPDTEVVDFLGLPVRIPQQPGDRMLATMRDVAASVPWQVFTTNFNLLDSHDTARLLSVAGDPARLVVAAGIMFTYPGIPMVFAGDEIGLQGITGEDSRRPFPWLQPDRWDTGILQAYQELADLRADHAALRHGGLRWVAVDAEGIVFLRETATQRLLVCACRGPAADITIPLADLGASSVTVRYGTIGAATADGMLTLSRQQAAVGVFSLD